MTDPSDKERQTHWLGKLANLNVAKTPGLGVAPHKPLMIFSVMDLIEMGVLRDRWVPYNADLVTRFRGYWNLVVERRGNRPEITMPFNALGSDRDAIWERFDEHGSSLNSLARGWNPWPIEPPKECGLLPIPWKARSDQALIPHIFSRREACVY